MPPCRSRSMSSIESAPATIPATSTGTLSCALTPPLAGSVSFSPTRSPSRQSCASATTGGSPPTHTRVGSSNVADNADEPCDGRIQRKPFCGDGNGPRQAASSLLKGAFVCYDPRSQPIRRWIGVQSLPLAGPLTLGFDPARFQTEPPVCYRASWQLPGPDFHRQATTSMNTTITPSPHEVTPCSAGRTKDPG